MGFSFSGIVSRMFSLGHTSRPLYPLRLAITPRACFAGALTGEGGLEDATRLAQTPDAA